VREMKFPDCGDCRFFNRKIERPQCKECGCGEFFEARVRNTVPTDDELMFIYRKDFDE
jgi:hypothetical protein